MESREVVHQSGRKVVMLLFGIVFPIIILAQAYFGLSSLSADVGYKQTPDNIVRMFNDAQKTLVNGNDYMLFAVLYSEHANQKTMVNKQVMKVAIMQIGFAVISVGMMLIILGFNDGGASGGAEVSGIKFDFQSGSTGVLVFLVGALMATAGGVLKNDYKTVPVPGFVYEDANHELIKSDTDISKKRTEGELK